MIVRELSSRCTHRRMFTELITKSKLVRNKQTNKCPSLCICLTVSFYGEHIIRSIIKVDDNRLKGVSPIEVLRLNFVLFLFTIRLYFMCKLLE